MQSSWKRVLSYLLKKTLLHIVYDNTYYYLFTQVIKEATVTAPFVWLGNMTKKICFLDNFFPKVVFEF